MASQGAVKCLASVGRSVYSGGTGDVIRIYDAPVRHLRSVLQEMDIVSERDGDGLVDSS